MLSQSSLEIVQATVPLVREHGAEITTLFYNNMLSAHPELYNLFNISNQSNGEQQQALAAAVYAYAANVTNPEVLEPVLSRIAHKHCSLGLLPSHYTIVGKYLLAAINEVLGEAVTVEVAAAWDEAYWQLACELISREAHLYHVQAVERGAELQSMKVVATHKESHEVRSLYLAPADGSAAGRFVPGQYVSVALTDPESGYRQLRQYSLSDAANDQGQWRITVKREVGDENRPGGLLSNVVHELQVGDSLDVSAAYGDFTLASNDDSRPLVLISAGVGITPMVSILNHLVEQNSSRPVRFIHAARQQSQQVLGSDISAAERKLGDFKASFFYEQRDDASTDYVHKGRLSLDQLSADFYPRDADYYLCGPLPFMRAQRQFLVQQGVDAERIRYEVFGPDLLLGLA